MWSVPFLRVLLVEHTSPLSPSSLPGCLFAVLSQGCPLHLIQPCQAAPPGLGLRGGAGDSHHMADRSPAASPGAMRKLTPDHSSERNQREKARQKCTGTNYITIWKRNSKFSTLWSADFLFSLFNAFTYHKYALISEKYRKFTRSHSNDRNGLHSFQKQAVPSESHYE